MNKRIFRVALLLLVATMLLSSCGKPPKMEVENGQYTNKKSGVTYLRAPMNYEATSIVKGKTVARVAQDKLADIVLYEIESTAPEKLRQLISGIKNSPGCFQRTAVSATGRIAHSGHGIYHSINHMLRFLTGSSSIIQINHCINPTAPKLP